MERGWKCGARMIYNPQVGCFSVVHLSCNERLFSLR